MIFSNILAYVEDDNSGGGWGTIATTITVPITIQRVATRSCDGISNRDLDLVTIE
jgi:hypothetical protein